MGATDLASLPVSLRLAQTGSGKTYTMIGGRSEDEWGVLPRAFADLFKATSERDDGTEFNFRVRLVKCAALRIDSSTTSPRSFMEVYNERIFDLLAPLSSSTLHGASVERPRSVYATSCLGRSHRNHTSLCLPSQPFTERH